MNAKLSGLSFLAAGALLLSATSANAIYIPISEYTPLVTDTVTPISLSSWQYSFTITNQSGVARGFVSAEDEEGIRIIDYQLPYFSDAHITSIQAPTGWAWIIVDEDTFSLGHGAQTLQWYATSIDYGIRGAGGYDFDCCDLGYTLGGFSFVADYSPVKSPFLAYSYSGHSYIGDPALPGSPNALSAGLTTALPVTSVPEPETYAMLLAGLGLLGFMARHRNII